MTSHDEVKVKVAMPEILGLYLVAFVALMVGLALLDVGIGPFGSMYMVFAFLPYAALAFGLVAVFSYFNDNMFATALFGILAVFFYGFPEVVGAQLGALTEFADTGMYVLFGAVFLIIMGAVSLAQPVKMVTGVIVLAGLTFLMVALWIWVGELDSSTYEMLGGLLGVITGLLSLYLPTAILFNTMKGKNVLPIM